MRRVNSCVAYIGDSVSDVIPIKAANLGFAMKATGCSMLEQNAQIKILDNNFNSVLNAGKWGFNIL